MRRTIPLAAALALALASPAGADAKAGQVDTSFGARP